MSYRAPVSKISFLLNEVLDASRLSQTEKFSEATPDMIEAIMSEAAKLSEAVMAPLNVVGDLNPAKIVDGRVKTSPGFFDAHQAIVEGGWIGMAASPEFGGMGLPLTATSAVNEMMSSACLSLALNPLMCQGQIEALEHHANDALKEKCLPKLVSGEWSGTMNLTEPHAGSDVGALRTKAEPNGDGTYAVTGQKIYISWGDHDLSENICHLVLARLPGAVAGTKGISLFLVPKFMPEGDGIGAENSLSVVSLEHKMGLHGSPTAVMEYRGATGWLVGEENAGMAAMFTMMNNARLGVGVQGLSQAEAALQKARSYAYERKQGRSPVENGHGTIIDHADVRRMLATMEALTFTARAICLDTALSLDLARALDGAEAKTHLARAALLTPIAKAFGTDTGCEVSEMAMQVYGGMGFIEETGIAQHYRDVRVTAIYEGTNGIQAMDLVGRKLMDGGDAARQLLAELDISVAAEKAALEETLDWMLGAEMNDRFAGAVSFLRAFAITLGGHYLAKSAKVDDSYAALSAFHHQQLLPQVEGLCKAAREGADPLYAIDFT